MNDLEILKAIADENKIEVRESVGNIGTYKVEFRINGAFVSGQFDVMNRGVYALDVGDVENFSKLIGRTIPK